jgi:hypothetical protein
MKQKVYIETSVVSYGYEPPLVCSPEELFGEWP